LGSADEVVTDSTSRGTVRNLDPLLPRGRAHELIYLCLVQMYSTSQNTNGITRLLHLEPARFWRCWRRFDDLGRRYVDLIRS
jgi:hypothetical protein